MGATPTMLHMISPALVPDLRIVSIGREVLTPKLLMAWSTVESRALYNEYGPTEATVTVTDVRCRPDMRFMSSIGKPSPRTCHLYILDEFQQLQPIGVPGELYIGGPQLARGYLNREDETKKKFVPNPFSSGREHEDRLYRSGDLCRWLCDGSIEYLGRIDQQVKLRGFRIELGEIENRILELKSVRACCVSLIKNEARGDILCGYVVFEDTFEQARIPELRSHLEQHLPAYMIPSAIVPISALPFGSTGKVNKSKLPHPSESNFFILKMMI